MVARPVHRRTFVPSDWHRACHATTFFGSRAIEGQENVTWGSATVRAAVMLVASFVLFAYLPDRLLTYLAVRTTPTVRDLLVSLSWVVTLVLAFWLFVRLQRDRNTRLNSSHMSISYAVFCLKKKKKKNT